ncbi:MAG: tetratricopeptide repeat protein [Promethearchaeota archaeon]
MANFFEQRERRVIPNWRSFSRTLKLGELRYPKIISESKDKTNLSIKDYLIGWEGSKSVSVAGDLISAAFVNGFTYNERVKEAAKYILKNKKKATDSLVSIVQIILESTSKNPKNNFFIKKLKKFNPADCHIEIKKYKKLINNFPYNPIAYVDLSRLYSVLGLEKKSIKNMKIALHLAPENRFVLRAAARLFSHFRQFEYIHDLIRKSEIVKIDPWITSTEIALATILDKRSKLIKTGLSMINSNNYAWNSLTELASSVGTLEFLNGNRKKAKKYLKIAIISPNDNSLAQIEWINNTDLLLDINPSDYDINNNYEALALYKYFNRDYKTAFDQCKEWFCDLPFSKRPVLLGSHIAYLLDKPSDEIEFLQKGFYSNPHDAQIINNLAYSLSIENRINDAEKYMDQINDISEISTNTKICLTATQGLIFFRKGQISKGIELYERAIAAAKSFNINHLIWLAKLNFARELILSRSALKSTIENLFLKIPDNTKFPDINKLKHEVIDLYNKDNNILPQKGPVVYNP